ncbi:hypothetical protein, partial [Mesorhizobium sp. WSM4306]|uniref:hypothetical protein n=1 Tax=Mesorhizobium sp. WSM4306 TaxID=2589885 RepID=UPI001AED1784
MEYMPGLTPRQPNKILAFVLLAASIVQSKRCRLPFFPLFELGTSRTGVRGHREQFCAFCAR